MSDGVPPRRFPIVNVLPIVANFAVFIFYEPPHLNTAVYHTLLPCSVDNACRAPELRLLGVPADEAARLTALPLPDTGAW